MNQLKLQQLKAAGGVAVELIEHIDYLQKTVDVAARIMKEKQEKIDKYRERDDEDCHKWIKFEHCEDIPVDQEVLTIDDCGDMFIDYVDVCSDTGGYYFANGAEPSYYMLIEKPKQDDDNETFR